MCKLNLPKVDNFATRMGRNNIEYQTNCKKCQKKYRREHYLKNKEKYINKAKKYRLNQKKWFIDEIKSKLECTSCDEKRYWVLDFHHKDPTKKDGSVGYIAGRFSKKRILEEIEKCVVLCSNCHRDLHYQENL